MTTSKTYTPFAIFAFFAALLVSYSAFSQKQANNWYFGYMGGLGFGVNGPQKLTDGAIDAFEGCAAYSDEDGNLLFYTNGGGSLPNLILNGERTGIIWNRNHEVMYDMGFTEGGGYSSGQSSLILPVPGSDHEYYLFTMDQQASLTGPIPNRGLSYFIIDMDLNGGLGGVSVANQPVYTPATECLSVALHQNGTDYWLITVDRNTEDFVVVPVTAAGVQTPFLQPRNSNDLGLVIKVSPDSKRLFHAYNLYDFDRATGSITFNTFLPTSSFYSFSFSPNSRYLFTLSGDLGKNLLRYDVTAPDIEASVMDIAYAGLTFPGGMQIGPDGNIYFCEQTEEIIFDALAGVSIIRCPDGDSPTYEPAVFTYSTEPTIDAFVGLPNYPDFIFDDLFDAVENIADTALLCGSGPAVLDATYPEATYEWSTGETAPSISTTTEGTYSVTVTNACGIPVLIRNFSVISAAEMIELPTLVFDLCPGESAQLSSSIPAEAYLWSTGDITASITTSTAGTYTLMATNGCATANQTFVVTSQALPAIEIQTSPILGSLCQSDTVTLTAFAPGISSFVWSSGDTMPTILAPAGETYTVSATNTCGEDEASIELPIGYCCMFEMPNAFSPNGDSTNDAFGPVTSDCEITNYLFQVFNRWGEEVFATTDPNAGWDGEVSGKSASSDVFVYLIVYDVVTESGTVERRKLSGDLTLLY